MQTNHDPAKVISGCFGGGRDRDRCEEVFVGDEYVHYFDCGDGLRGRMYMPKFSKLRTLNTRTLLYGICTSKKL